MAPTSRKRERKKRVDRRVPPLGGRPLRGRGGGFTWRAFVTVSALGSFEAGGAGGARGSGQQHGMVVVDVAGPELRTEAAVLAVLAVLTVLAVLSVLAVLTVLTVLAVLSVLAVFAESAAGAVLSVFARSAGRSRGSVLAVLSRGSCFFSNAKNCSFLFCLSIKSRSVQWQRTGWADGSGFAVLAVLSVDAVLAVLAGGAGRADGSGQTRRAVLSVLAVLTGRARNSCCSVHRIAKADQLDSMPFFHPFSLFFFQSIQPMETNVLLMIMAPSGTRILFYLKHCLGR